MQWGRRYERHIQSRYSPDQVTSQTSSAAEKSSTIAAAETSARFFILALCRDSPKGSHGIWAEMNYSRMLRTAIFLDLGGEPPEVVLLAFRPS